MKIFVHLVLLNLNLKTLKSVVDSLYKIFKHGEISTLPIFSDVVLVIELNLMELNETQTAELNKMKNKCIKEWNLGKRANI